MLEMRYLLVTRCKFVRIIHVSQWCGKEDGTIREPLGWQDTCQDAVVSLASAFYLVQTKLGGNYKHLESGANAMLQHHGGYICDTADRLLEVLSNVCHVGLI